MDDEECDGAYMYRRYTMLQYESKNEILDKGQRNVIHLLGPTTTSLFRFFGVPSFSGVPVAFLFDDDGFVDDEPLPVEEL